MQNTNCDAFFLLWYKLVQSKKIVGFSETIFILCFAITHVYLISSRRNQRAQQLRYQLQWQSVGRRNWMSDNCRRYTHPFLVFILHVIRFFLTLLTLWNKTIFFKYYTGIYSSVDVHVSDSQFFFFHFEIISCMSSERFGKCFEQIQGWIERWMYSHRLVTVPFLIICML